MRRMALVIILTISVGIIFFNGTVGIPKFDNLSSDVRQNSGIRDLETFNSYLVDKNIKATEIIGRLEVQVHEDFSINPPSSDYQYSVVSNQGETIFTPVNMLEDREVLERYAGKEVKVFSYIEKEEELGFVDIPKDIEREAQINNLNNSEKMLVLLVEFNDSEEPSAYPDDGRPIVDKNTLASYLNTKFYKKYLILFILKLSLIFRKI